MGARNLARHRGPIARQRRYRMGSAPHGGVRGLNPFQTRFDPTLRPRFWPAASPRRGRRPGKRGGGTLFLAPSRTLPHYLTLSHNVACSLSQAEIAKDGLGFVNIEVLASFRRMKVAFLISQHVFMKSFCRDQFPHKFVNIFFASVTIKDTLTDLWGN